MDHSGRDACFFVLQTGNSGVVTLSEANPRFQFRRSALASLGLYTLAAVFLSWPMTGAAQTPLHAPDYTDRIIVKLKPSTSTPGAVGISTGSAPDLSASAGVSLRAVEAATDGRRVLALPRRMTESEVEDIAARLRADPAVEYAEPDRRLYPSAVPNDPYYSYQWDFKGPADGVAGGADLSGAWDVTTGDSAVVVAVIDTGILPHADLAGRTLAGYDFISDARTANDGDGRDADPFDPGDWITAEESAGTDATGGYFSGCAAANSTWHGTHVAGTLAAAADNSIGVAGINWKSKLLPLRVLGKCGGYSSDIADAIRWAAGMPVSGVPDNPHPAQVINLSLSGAGACGQDEQQAIDAANAAGSIVVAAAGNDNAAAAADHPGNCRGVITVAAADRDGGRSTYSDYGSIVDITAPGGGSGSAIYSTLDHGIHAPLYDNSYGFFIGTSMAAAHVSGAISLMLSANYAVTHAMLPRSTVVTKLLGAARAFPANTGNDCTTDTCGFGLLDTADAVRAVSTAPAADAGPDAAVDGGTPVSLNGGNSSDPGGHIVSYTWTQVGGTSVVLNNADTATPSFIAPGGSDVLTFRLTVTDDVGLSANDTVSIAVAGSDGAPVAKIGVISLDEDTVYVGNLSATDVNGKPLTYSIVANGERGTAVITDAADGQFTYTPNANFNGQDSFTFKVNNGSADSNTATMAVTIRPVNDPPVATGATFSMQTATSLSARMVAGDVDGDGLIYTIVSPPRYGTVILTDNAGHFVYSLYRAAGGGDSFTYEVSDGSATSNTATVTINFDGSGTNPTLTSNGVKGLVLVSGATARVTFDVIDPAPGGDAPVYTVAQPTLGAASFSGDVLTYTAAAPGTELLAVTVQDADGSTGVMLMPVTVNTAGVMDSNGDGLSDFQASRLGLDPKAVNGDSDGDGIADIYEVGDPAHPADSDGDGIIDALEPGAAAADAARMSFVVTPPAAAGLGLGALAGQTLSVSVSAGARLSGTVNGDTGVPLYDKQTAAAGDRGYDYPLGLLDYTVFTSSHQATVTVALSPGVGLPDGSVVRKQDVDGLWQTVPGAVIDAEHHTITVTLRDNDEFDLDPAAGVIHDPLGIAGVAAVTVSSQASSNDAAGGGSGGGGAVGVRVLLSLGLLAVLRRRALSSQQRGSC